MKIKISKTVVVKEEFEIDYNNIDVYLGDSIDTDNRRLHLEYEGGVIRGNNHINLRTNIVHLNIDESMFYTALDCTDFESKLTRMIERREIQLK